MLGTSVKKVPPSERTTVTDHGARLAALARAEAIIQAEQKRRDAASGAATATAGGAAAGGAAAAAAGSSAATNYFKGQLPQLPVGFTWPGL